MTRRLAPETIELLAGAVARFGALERSESLRAMGSRSQVPSIIRGSRQARHARLLRSRILAVAATYALAPKNADYRRLIHSPELARWRPLSAQHHTRFIHLAGRFGAFSPSDCDRLWDLGEAGILERCKHPESLSDDEALVVNSLLCALFVGAVLHPRRLRRRWRNLIPKAEACGLLESPYLRRQLAFIGAYVGTSDMLVNWLMVEQNHPHELSYAFAFARRDRSPAVLHQEIEHIRCQEVHPTAVRPSVTTLNQLAGYVRTCMREPRHFCNVGLVLALLVWIDDLVHRYGRLRDERKHDETMVSLGTALHRIERVQRIEKNRFYRILEETPEGPLRDRLACLWFRDIANA